MFKEWFSRFRRPPQVHAAREDAPAAGVEPGFLRRDPILDGTQALVGYAFAVQHPEGEREWSAISRRFFDDALLDRIERCNLQALSGRRQACLGLGADALARPLLDRLAGLGTLVKLQSGKDATALTPEAVSRLRALCGAGLVCLVPDTGLSEIDALAIGVHMPVAQLSPPDLVARVRDARRRFPGKRLMATGVDSVELFDACTHLGFDLFEGHHLTQRGEQRPPNLNSQRLVVTQVISHLRRKDTDFDKLALLARQDLALTLRLLRYINSAAMGLRHKVGTLEQAMTYIGRDGLYRWLTLLLFYDSRQSQVDAALRETALARGRFCELLARRRLAKSDCEQAFVTGLLSLVDVLFSMPIEEALGHLGLPDEIHAALARQEGKYGAYVGLTLAYERGDAPTITALAQRLELSLPEIDDLHMQALAWALDYGAGLESD